MLPAPTTADRSDANPIKPAPNAAAAGIDGATRPMVQATQQQILEIIQKHAQGAPVTITADTLLEESGIDSYGLIEVVFELEEALGIDIPYNANDNVFNDARTIGDLLDRLQALIEKA